MADSTGCGITARLGSSSKIISSNIGGSVMVRERDDVVGLDGAILTHPRSAEGERSRTIPLPTRWSIAGLAKRDCAPISSRKKWRQAMPKLRRQRLN